MLVVEYEDLTFVETPYLEIAPKNLPSYACRYQNITCPVGVIQMQILREFGLTFMLSEQILCYLD